MAKPRRPNRSDEEKQAIIHAYSETGIPVQDIEQAYDISTGNLYHLLEAAGVPTRNKQEELQPRWEGRYEQGPHGPVWVHASVQPPLDDDPVVPGYRPPEPEGFELGEAVEVDTTPPEQVKRRGGARANSGPVRVTTQEQEEAIVAAYQAGERNVKRLAQRFGVSDSLVYRRLNERGIAPRDARGRPRLYSNGTAIVKAPPPLFPRAGQLAVMSRGWTVEYTIVGRYELNAPTLDEALRVARQALGEGAAISSINPS